MVFGLGGVGMAAVLTAVSLEHNVIGVDTLPAKLEMARERRDTGFTPAETIDGGITAPVVIEAAGNARACEVAVAATSPGGTTVTVGLPAPSQVSTISPLALVAQACTIIGCYLGSARPARDIAMYTQWWRDGKLPVEKLISARIALSDINVAMDDLSMGRAIVR